jgi:hypothetical protein
MNGSRRVVRHAIGRDRASRFAVLVGSLLPMLFLLSAVSGGAASASATTGREGVPALAHVFLLYGENTTYLHVNSTNMPYLMDTIRPQSAWLTQYRATTHWSEANYVAITSGQFTKCEQQDYGVACHQNVPNLYNQLDVAGKSWTTWLEGGTARCDTGSGSSCGPPGPCPLTGFYTTGNPPTIYDNIEGAGGVWSATNRSQECLNYDIPAGPLPNGTGGPMGVFNQALASGNVPAFNYVIPNGCDDGEGNCKPINNRYTQFDRFLKREVPKIESSPAFGNNSIIIVTYDEDERAGGLAKKNGFGSGGHVVCAIFGGPVAPGEYGTDYVAYGLLRMIEDAFGVNGYVGYANDVIPITGIWK